MEKPEEKLSENQKEETVSKTEQKQKAPSENASKNRSISSSSKNSSKSSKKSKTSKTPASPSPPRERTRQFKTIYIKNLPDNPTEKMLETHFGQFGQITSLTLMKDRFTQESLGYCFITFSTSDQAQTCIDQTNNTKLEGKTLRVEISNRSGPRRATPGKYLGATKKGYERDGRRYPQRRRDYGGYRDHGGYHRGGRERFREGVGRRERDYGREREFRGERERFREDFGRRERDYGREREYRERGAERHVYRERREEGRERREDGRREDGRRERDYGRRKRSLDFSKSD